MLLFKKSFKIVNWKLLFLLFIMLLIPAIYKTFRSFFIGTLPDSYSFSIAGNLNWIDVLFEVLEEAFLLPLFFILNKLIKIKNSNREIIGKIYLILFIYLLMITIFLIFTKQIIYAMSVKELNNNIILFVRAEFPTRFFIMFVKLLSILLISKNKWKGLIYFLIINTTINILLDLFIVSDNYFSLKKGVVWISYNQLFSSFVSSIFLFSLVIKTYSMKYKDFLHPFFKMSFKLFRQNIYSGLESLIRNGFFILFVIKTINRLPGNYNQGDFWVMNNFIWNWLLIPILAISQYVNRQEAFKNKNVTLKETLIAPFLIVSFVILLWFLTIPFWKDFIHYALNNNDYKIIFKLALISIGFYVLFAFNNIIDKFFMGSGQAKLILFQSLLTNILVYIPYYFLISKISIYDVAIMMGLAIGVDSILTFIMFWFNLKYRNTFLIKN